MDTKIKKIDRIVMILKAAQRPMAAMEIARLLNLPTRECREAMKASPRIKVSAKQIDGRTAYEPTGEG